MRSIYLLAVIATMVLISVCSVRNAHLVSSEVIKFFWWYVGLSAAALVGYTAAVWTKEIAEKKYRLTFLADGRHACTVMAVGASFFFGSGQPTDVVLGEFGNVLWMSMAFVFAVFSGVFLLMFVFPEYTRIGNNHYEAVEETPANRDHLRP